MSGSDKAIVATALPLFPVLAKEGGAGPIVMGGEKPSPRPGTARGAFDLAEELGKIAKHVEEQQKEVEALRTRGRTVPGTETTVGDAIGDVSKAIKALAKYPDRESDIAAVHASRGGLERAGADWAKQHKSDKIEKAILAALADADHALSLVQAPATKARIDAASQVERLAELFPAKDTTLHGIARKLVEALRSGAPQRIAEAESAITEQAAIAHDTINGEILAAIETLAFDPAQRPATMSAQEWDRERLTASAEFEAIADKLGEPLLRGHTDLLNLIRKAAVRAWLISRNPADDKLKTAPPDGALVVSEQVEALSRDVTDEKIAGILGRVALRLRKASGK